MNDELKDVGMVRIWCMIISYPTETALGLWSAALHVGSGVMGWGACHASQLAGPRPVTVLSGFLCSRTSDCNCPFGPKEYWLLQVNVEKRVHWG